MKRDKVWWAELDPVERMVLAGADLDAFLDAVMHPPEPTKKLVAALKRHRARCDDARP